MIVHIRKQVNDKARGKIKKRIKNSEAVSSSTLTEPIAYKTAEKEEQRVSACRLEFGTQTLMPLTTKDKVERSEKPHSVHDGT